MVLVLSTVKLSPEKQAALEREFPEVTLSITQDMAAVRERWSEIEVLVSQLGTELTPDFLNQATSLRWVQIFAAGADLLPFTQLKERGIQVSNVSGIHKTAMAEQAFCYLLGFVRRAAEFMQAQQRHQWRRPKGFYAFSQLKGKTLVVVGAGNIGQEIARLGQAFGMQTVGVNSDGRAAAHFERTYSTAQLKEAVGQGDFIVVVVPLTPATRGLIGAAEFAAMKDGAYFVNLARGPVVDQVALTGALKTGRLAGAGLDVFDPEPLPADSPLWDLPNVTITPHIGGWAADYWDNAWQVFRTNLRQFLAGEALTTAVNLDLGY
ncbi:MAG: D-2-hydroxyacid dehydrogenase [bacterium]